MVPNLLGVSNCQDIVSSINVNNNGQKLAIQQQSTMQEKKQQTFESKEQTNPIVEQQKEADEIKKEPTVLEQAMKRQQEKVKQLIASIREIQNQQVELEVNEKLTAEKKEENKSKIRDITKQILAFEHGIVQIKIKSEHELITESSKYEQLIGEEVKNYQPTEQSLNTRFNELVQQPNDSNWTDATESQADDDEIWVVDDDIIKAMEQDSGEEEQENESEEIKEKEDHQKQQINLDELEDQFVVGQQSDHLGLFGKHDKFCVSVNGIAKESLLVSGGGDDYLYMYKLPKQEMEPTKCLHPFHIVKHTETVSKVELSFSKQFIFSMTDNQILCTQIKTQQTTTLKSKEKPKDQSKEEQNKNKKQMKQMRGKQSQSDEEDEEPICSDMVCHHLGDVVAVSSGYELEVYNIKGLKLYQTYYCEKMIDMIAFTEGGKQIVLACQDSKLRLLTPKTSEIVTVGGVKQHQTEISVIKSKGDILLSGCLDGYIGITTLKKATMTTLIGTKETESLEGAINQLEFAGAYFMAGCTEGRIDWYDLGKAKKLIQSPIEGSSSDICWQGSDYQHLYNVSTIKGYIHVYDCRNPLKEINKTRAGNTIHKLWCESYNIAAACEDGHVRLYDIRKLI